MPADQILNVVPNDKAVVIVIQCREFDHAKTEQLKGQLTSIAAGSPDRPILLNLSKVEFMASATLGALVEMRNTFNKAGRRMVLVCVAPAITKLMEATAMQNLFEIHDTVEKALS